MHNLKKAWDGLRGCLALERLHLLSEITLSERENGMGDLGWVAEKVIGS